MPFLSVPVRYGEHSRLACHTKLTYGLSTQGVRTRLRARHEPSNNTYGQAYLGA
jgi:hypothetical protein